ncbi:MAG: helix-turn-helix transcriptional regulator [Firmicutes bacterium]|nr:helix-turn-helix transcriptional regulator [Bacillota bacterium]
MALGERIKECRKRSGMSQEKLAELMDVSRQAVTKWESGQSAPSTENLFKLAEIFDTTVDLLLESKTDESPSTAEQIYQQYKAEQGKKKVRRIQNIKTFLLFVGAYLVIYLLGRMIWCDMRESTFLGWLALSRPSGEHSYLYGWLLSSNMYWIGMGISILPILIGKKRFAAVTLSGFALGLITGILFGPYPAGVPYGQGDYGWAIWGGVFIASIIVGIIVECVKRKMGRAT